MSNDSPCGANTNCVWRASKKLTNSGHKTTVTDLCIAISAWGEPCGVKATIVIGPEDLRYGQPFCTEHATQIITGLEHKLSETPTKPKPRPRSNYRAPSRKLHDDHIYLARRGDQVKIGHTRQWRVRLRNLELNAGAPFDEVVIHPGSRALEARLHRKHEEHLIHGEWFRAAPSVVAEMKALARSEDAITDWQSKIKHYENVGNYKQQPSW